MARGKSSVVVRCDKPEACPVVEACVQGGRVPCLDVPRWHDQKMRLCDELEAIADGLPSRVDRLKCLLVANELVPLLRRSHAYEEEHIFPAFAHDSINEGARGASIRRLKAEHVEDECSAQDLTDALLEIGHGAVIANPEALGFMLRGFFDSMRRHVAFEREHVLPLIPASEVG
ncbi:hemerythrin domain-containing protein [Mesorhizobium sp. B2-5-13]|uniref:hemerythrin domain-containing protein n=1 Tax=unclassified Mesorhizobium TaxID=325217 RepID=UPI001127A154|nr:MULTISPECIES: hemerythrin domain-containing protein [unclassified Mesorhizobium]TPJ38804.1 hemerythrin domain-containing protein [Mesorhizobium sp. B2-6-5]TPJ79518.1 hemerythrin domain-containing protein [Mesorhizobium sp. B2-5-13]TPK46337.1 hemerythrin domain-containing protein [Mesorhizobium sp. B2-5-5]